MSNCPNEFFNEQILKSEVNESFPLHFRDYFEQLLLKNTKGGVFGCEIDARRYHWLLELIDLDAALQPGAAIPIIWLTRQDIVSQAYSLAMAKVSQQWHIFSETGMFTNKYHGIKRIFSSFLSTGTASGRLGKQQKDTSVESTPSVVDDEIIWENLFHILKFEQLLEKKIRRNKFTPLRITYEQLVCEQDAVISRLFAYIGFDMPDVQMAISKIGKKKNPTLKMPYPKKIEELTSFYARHANVINAIQASRLHITEETVREMIAESNAGTYYEK